MRVWGWNTDHLRNGARVEDCERIGIEIGFLNFLTSGPVL